MRDSKGTLPLVRLTSINDHPAVCAIAQELEKVRAEKKRAETRFQETEAEKEQAWHRAVEAMGQGKPTPEEFKQARVAVEHAQEEIELADLALAAVQQRRDEAIAQAKREVSELLRGEYREAVRDLGRAFAPVMERNERVRSLWATAQTLLGNEQSAIPRLFWRELIGPEQFPESRVGYWRRYVIENFPWIKLDG